MPALAFTPASYWRRKFLFSAAERSFYQVLRQLIPAHTVFAKVRFSDLLSPVKSKRARHHRGIESKQLDFLICDATLAPVMALEFDDESPAKTDDQLVDAALAAVDVPVVHIPARRSYALDEVRQWIFPQLQASSSAC
jgi:Protein of unknown function (DUF2726)